MFLEVVLFQQLDLIKFLSAGLQLTSKSSFGLVDTNHQWAALSGV